MFLYTRFKYLVIIKYPSQTKVLDLFIWQVALDYPQPLIHFALVCGTRSGPALWCYSPGKIEEELQDAARNFLRRGGLLVDLPAKAAFVSKILKW